MGINMIRSRGGEVKMDEARVNSSLGGGIFYIAFNPTQPVWWATAGLALLLRAGSYGNPRRRAGNCWALALGLWVLCLRFIHYASSCQLRESETAPDIHDPRAFPYSSRSTLRTTGTREDSSLLLSFFLTGEDLRRDSSVVRSKGLWFHAKIGYQETTRIEKPLQVESWGFQNSI